MKEAFDLPPEQWSTLRRLLDDALARPPEARATWIDSLADDYAPLKQRLRSLLDLAAPGRASPLDTLPKIETAQLVAERRAGERPGSLVGPYRLLRALGEGGMGTVWLAERSDVLQRRQVALKLPRLVTGRAGLEERLARECEILGTLDHPNIARLYDAGVTDAGQPWLAMQYVEGERIDAYCSRKSLGVDARLRLFVQVAAAVAHAHSRLVVHRDLKPANILVTEGGEVRLLDFGIAKLLEDGPADETELTRLAGRALTPEYAAPEQIVGRPIGTGADVYALGVVLFELLTGSRPYRVRRGSQAALEDAIAQAEVRRPSDAATDRSLARRLRGDLDTIVLKALKPEPADRYGTAAAFADDVERYLTRQPVRARPDSAWYRARKFVVRNKGAVAGVTAGVAVLVAAAALATWQAQIAVREQKRAEQVKSLIASIFQDVNPSMRTGEALTALDLLAQARARVERNVALDPVSRAELLSVLADSYWGLNESRIAAELAGQALAAGAAALAPDDPLMLRIELVRANSRHALGDRAEARAIVTRLVQAIEANGRVDTDARLYAKAQAVLTTFEMNEGRPGSALAFEAASKAVRVVEQAALDDEVAVFAHQVMASVHRWRNETTQARDHAGLAYRKALALYGEDGRHARTLEAQNEYGRALARVGELAEAVRMMQRAAELAPEVLGPRHVMVQHFLGTLGALQLDYGLVKEGLRSLQQAAAADLRDVKVSATYEASRHVAMARAHLAVGQAAAALPLYQKAVELLDRAQPRGSVHWQAEAEYGLALALNGEPARAIARLEPFVDERRQGDIGTLQGALRALATAQRIAGDAEAAERSIEQARVLLERLNAAPHPAATHRVGQADALREAGLIALDRGDATAAEARFAAAVERFRATQAGMTPARAEAMTGLARAQLLMGRPSDAIVHADAAAQFWSAFDPRNRAAGEAAFWLARCHAALGQHAAAKAAYARAAELLSTSPLAGDRALARQARAG
jgi:serine/threonine-protein kinase